MSVDGVGRRCGSTVSVISCESSVISAAATRTSVLRMTALSAGTRAEKQRDAEELHADEERAE